MEFNLKNAHKSKMMHKILQVSQSNLYPYPWFVLVLQIQPILFEWNTFLNSVFPQHMWDKLHETCSKLSLGSDSHGHDPI